jgi:hypothetical protein
MPITVQVPTEGALQITGAVVTTAIPAGVTIQTPTDGALGIIGALVTGTLSGGVFTPGRINP